MDSVAGASSSSSLSEEEFHRLQLQLIDLRTQNYELGHACKKQESELNSLKQQYENVDKELQRMNKAIGKSKKAKEFDILLQENESLQRKLNSQDDEFRLQNSILMQELSNLVSKNEELEATINQLKEAKPDVSTNQVSYSDTSKLNEEIIYLRAENIALQNNIGEIKGKFESELKLLRSVVDSVDITDSVNSSISLAGDKSLTSMLQESELLSQFNELKLSNDTVVEENRLLKVKIGELEKTSSAEAVEQHKDKLRKKQESFLNLQAEKEALFEETSKKIKFLEEARQRDIKNFHSQIERLNEEINKSKEENSNIQKQAEIKCTELEATIKSLKTKVDEASLKNVEQMRVELEKLRTDFSNSSEGAKSLRVNYDDALSKLKASEQSLAEAFQSYDQISQKLKDTESQLAEKSQLAERRKKLLDELAIKLQEDGEMYKSKIAQLENSKKQEIEDLKAKHKSELHELTQLLKHEQTRNAEFDQCRTDLDNMRQQSKSLEEAKAWLQRSLQDLQINLDEQIKAHAIQIGEMRDSHNVELSALESNNGETLQRVQADNLKLVSQLQETQAEVDTLQQKVKDHGHDMKLHEKKGASLMKDLKKQLEQEKKRTERMEQKIQELLSESKLHKSAVGEGFFLPIESDRLSVRGDDTSSVSSFSIATSSVIVGSTSNRDMLNTSVRESTPHSTQSNGEHDVHSLLILVDSLQREKTLLCERVSILEQSNSAMAEDMLKKQALIEHYTLEGKDYVRSLPKRAEKMTLKRVMDFVKDKGDETLMEKYRKCQIMLEETLTKNMCLQNDLEVLSKQIAEAKTTKETTAN